VLLYEGAIRFASQSIARSTPATSPARTTRASARRPSCPRCRVARPLGRRRREPAGQPLRLHARATRRLERRQGPGSTREVIALLREAAAGLARHRRTGAAAATPPRPRSGPLHPSPPAAPGSAALSVFQRSIPEQPYMRIESEWSPSRPSCPHSTRRADQTGASRCPARPVSTHRGIVLPADAVADRLAGFLAADPGLAEAISAHLPAARQACARTRRVRPCGPAAGRVEVRPTSAADVQGSSPSDGRTTTSDTGTHERQTEHQAVSMATTTSTSGRPSSSPGDLRARHGQHHPGDARRREGALTAITNHGTALQARRTAYGQLQDAACRRCRPPAGPSRPEDPPGHARPGPRTPASMNPHRQARAR